MAMRRVHKLLKYQHDLSKFGVLSIRNVTAFPSHKEIIKPLLQTSDERTDAEWLNAKDFKDMPGPSAIGLLLDFMPGGKLYKSNMVEMNNIWHETYGDVFILKGSFGKLDMVCTHNPKDFEVAYRNEGPWPIRMGLDTFSYYRLVKRPDIFQGTAGLITENGPEWGHFRNKMNPILMKIQNIRPNVTKINEVADEFMARLKKIHDPTTNTLTDNFLTQMKLYSFEAVSRIALNTRMGMLSDKPDPFAPTLVQNMDDFFELSFQFDIVPSFWKYFETPSFKKLMNTYESATNITTHYINEAISKIEDNGGVEKNASEAESVLEKVCHVDKKVAVIMAIDMLMAGIDTTSSAFTTVLFWISRNPAKQDILFQELKKLMPDPNTPLTEENTKNIPYLRACIKEALRITPITPNNFRVAVKDLVLSGYKVPRGTGILMNGMATSNNEEYFPRSKEFLPERWLKSNPMACPEAKHKNPFVYMPFGFGPRTCIGKRIAELEIETLMAKLLRNYRVTWNSKKDLEYVSNLILMPKENQVHFKFEPIKE